MLGPGTAGSQARTWRQPEPDCPRKALDGDGGGPGHVQPGLPTVESQELQSSWLSASSAPTPENLSGDHDQVDDVELDHGWSSLSRSSRRWWWARLSSSRRRKHSSFAARLVRQAHDEMECDRATGKLVIRVPD
jgi:hypothetical protein